MNTSSEIFGSNSSDHNSTEVENGFEMTFYVTIFNILLGFPTNSYVIWLIVAGKGNGPVAEFFSLKLAVCEILICVDCVFYLLKYKFQILWIVVYFLDGFAITVRPLFQCLMCVERYLAVVHPVTFLKYKPLRYRLICSVLVYVAGFISCGINIMTFLLSLIKLYYALIFVQFFLFYLFQLFCCVAVLRALKQSGPGERKRDEENHIKRKAFFIILITNVTLTILYAPYIIFMGLYSEQPSDTFNSVCYASFMLTSLVQPLAFFYRVEKLPFMKCQ